MKIKLIIVQFKIFIIWGGIFLPLAEVYSQEYLPSPSHIQGALLFRFAQNYTLVKDETPRETLNFCIFGDETVNEVIREIVSDETIGGKKIVVNTYNTIGEYYKENKHLVCDVCYVAATMKPDLKLITKSEEFKTTLTVSNASGFIDEGGIIEYVKRGDQVKYIVNLEMAKKHGIQISEQLLNFAEKIIK